MKESKLKRDEKHRKKSQEPHHPAGELVAPLFATATSAHYFQQSDQ